MVVACSDSGTGGTDPPDAAAADAGPVCGNGVVEPGEPCDDGDSDDADLCTSACSIAGEPTAAVVRWSFNREAVPGFEGDACTDLGAARVAVELVHAGDPSVRYRAFEDCALRQVTFLTVPSGSYAVELRVLDGVGADLTRAPITALAEHEVTDVNIAPDDWARDYDGSFFFRVRWNGMDCGDADPPVAQQRLRLERAGVAIADTTTAGDAFDGSESSPCRPYADLSPQSALGVPWGHATITIVGYDNRGAELYRGTRATFIGAGPTNPELLFDVHPSL